MKAENFLGCNGGKYQIIEWLNGNLLTRPNKVLQRIN